MQYFGIYEVAKELETSHTTIYNKLKNREIKKEIKQFIKKSGNKTYISLEGVEILKSHINHYKSDDKNGTEDNTNNSCNTLNDGILKEKETLINYLQKQINIKDEQLKNSYEQLNKLTQITENFQVLLKQSNEKILLLEQREVPSKSGFLKRVFSRAKEA